MPRDLPLGNGSLRVNLDRDSPLRDISFPTVGEENHSEGNPFSPGVFADGQFACSEAYGRFLRMLVPYGSAVEADPALDASLYGLFAFGAYDHPRDPRVEATMRALEDRLWVKTGVGDLARYERDDYHRVAGDYDHVPGNPWLICTLWLAQYRIARARTVTELEEALPTFN